MFFLVDFLNQLIKEEEMETFEMETEYFRRAIEYYYERLLKGWFGFLHILYR